MPVKKPPAEPVLDKPARGTRVQQTITKDTLPIPEENDTDEIEDIEASIGEQGFKIKVFKRNLTGESAYLGRDQSPLTFDEIRDRWGSGLFLLEKWWHGPNRARKKIATFKVNIAGITSSDEPQEASSSLPGNDTARLLEMQYKMMQDMEARLEKRIEQTVAATVQVLLSRIPEGSARESAGIDIGKILSSLFEMLATQGERYNAAFQGGNASAMGLVRDLLPFILNTRTALGTGQAMNPMDDEEDDEPSLAEAIQNPSLFLEYPGLLEKGKNTISQVFDGMKAQSPGYPITPETRETMRRAQAAQAALVAQRYGGGPSSNAPSNPGPSRGSQFTGPDGKVYERIDLSKVPDPVPLPTDPGNLHPGVPPEEQTAPPVDIPEENG